MVLRFLEGAGTFVFSVASCIVAVAVGGGEWGVAPPFPTGGLWVCGSDWLGGWGCCPGSSEVVCCWGPSGCALDVGSVVLPRPAGVVLGFLFGGGWSGVAPFHSPN